MSLSEKIVADLGTAMKKREASVVDTLRMLRAAVKNAEIDKHGPLDDAGIVALIRTSIKQLRDSIEQFKAGGRQDLADKAEAEIVTLAGYLPPELSDAELEAAVDKAIAALGATSAKDFGKVMGAVSSELKGRVEGSKLSAVVKNRLGGV